MVSYVEQLYYQEQRGKLRLVEYNCKKLSPAAIRVFVNLNYMYYHSVYSYKRILKNIKFTVIIHHSALLHIHNAIKEPPTLKLENFIEINSKYALKVKVLRDRDMRLSNFLSRHPGHDLTSPKEIISTSFKSKIG